LLEELSVGKGPHDNLPASTHHFVETTRLKP
jgi:hypothetical protein